MKISVAIRNRQRRLEVASRLPPFLRATGCPISLNTSTRFHKNAADLLDIDGWSEECNCTLKGVLFLWRVFMALFAYSKFPDGTASLYDPEDEDDILLADPKFWVHESKIHSCDSCLTRLQHLLDTLRDHFLPPNTMVHWGRHLVRIAFFSDFTHAWVLENGPRIFEMGAMYHASLISFILSPNRAIDCTLKESCGSDLALSITEPKFHRLRDVLGGLLEGGYSLTFSSCSQPRSQLLIHRIDSHFGNLDPLGSIRYGTLSNWGVGDKRKFPVHPIHQRRLPPFIKNKIFEAAKIFLPVWPTSSISLSLSHSTIFNLRFHARQAVQLLLLCHSWIQLQSGIQLPQPFVESDPGSTPRSSLSSPFVICPICSVDIPRSPPSPSTFTFIQVSGIDQINVSSIRLRAPPPSRCSFATFRTDTAQIAERERRKPSPDCSPWTC